MADVCLLLLEEDEIAEDRHYEDGGHDGDAEGAVLSQPETHAGVFGISKVQKAVYDGEIVQKAVYDGEIAAVLHLHEVVEEVLHAQVECDDEGEEEDLDGVLDDDRYVRLVPFEFFEKAHESAPTVGDALFDVLEGEFLRLIFLHY